MIRSYYFLSKTLFVVENDFTPNIIGFLSHVRDHLNVVIAPQLDSGVAIDSQLQVKILNKAIQNIPKLTTLIPYEKKMEMVSLLIETVHFLNYAPEKSENFDEQLKAAHIRRFYTAYSFMQSSNTLILFKENLYHYVATDYTPPNGKSSTHIELIKLALKKNRYEYNYKLCKQALEEQPSNRIRKANYPQQYAMSVLTNVNPDLVSKEITAALLGKFFKKIQQVLKNHVGKWRNDKYARWFNCSDIAKVIGVLCLLNVLFPLTKIAIIVQLAMMPMLAIGLFEFGVLVYCYAYERYYQNLLDDFTKIDVLTADQKPKLVSINLFFKNNQDKLASDFIFHRSDLSVDNHSHLN